MSENVQKWAKEVSAAADHAVKVYTDEVNSLNAKVTAADKREDREVTHVSNQVARDISFAEHHIDYLEKVVAKEDARVDSAHERLAQRAADGASDASVQRATEHVAKVEVSAEKRVQRVLDRVIGEIERDAKAAARHIVVGLEKIGEYEEDLGDEATADADRVAKALEKLNDKVAG